MNCLLNYSIKFGACNQIPEVGKQRSMMTNEWLVSLFICLFVCLFVCLLIGWICYLFIFCFKGRRVLRYQHQVQLRWAAPVSCSSAVRKATARTASRPVSWASPEVSFHGVWKCTLKCRRPPSARLSSVKRRRPPLASRRNRPPSPWPMMAAPPRALWPDLFSVIRYTSSSVFHIDFIAPLFIIFQFL